jgi:NADP-dependent 3-hydroxy acid dehydrogenase YdfG
LCGSPRRPDQGADHEIGGTAVVTDVTDDDVLVNNAGGAGGLEPVADADLENWRWMWEANVLGTLRVSRALLPRLIASGDGLIVTVTSIAAVEIYDGGSGYTSAKHAQGVLHRTLAGSCSETGSAHRSCAPAR